MLEGHAVTTILPVSDPARARRYYEEVLGLEYLGLSGDGKELFRLGTDGTLALLEKPPGAAAEHTALSFETSEIGTTIRELQARGVDFEDYDLPGLRTVDHVCVLGSEKAAWFRDPEGNILCVHEII